MINHGIGGLDLSKILVLKAVSYPGVIMYVCNPRSQEDYKFKDSLGNIERADMKAK